MYEICSITHILFIVPTIDYLQSISETSIKVFVLTCTSFHHRPKPEEMKKSKGEKVESNSKDDNTKIESKSKRTLSNKAIKRQERKLKCIKEKKGKMKFVLLVLDTR